MISIALPAGALARPQIGMLCAALLIGAGLAGAGAILTGPAGWTTRQVVVGLIGYSALAVAVSVLHAWHGPRGRLGHANLVTLGRAGLTCLIGGALLAGDASTLNWSLVLLVGLALALDGLDGWLARRFDEVSTFGARFDMEVDALLILILSSLAWQTGRVEAWVLLIGLMRYGFVIAARLLPWLRRPLPPSWRRKAICALQGIALWLALSPVIGATIAGLVSATALVALSISFALDVQRLHRARGALPLRPKALDCRIGCATLRPDRDVVR